MVLTIIVGSARSNGSSSYIADAIAAEWISNKGNTCKKYQVSDMNIEYCTGCKNCYQNGICPIKDDMHQIINSVLLSDYVVVISPSYWAGVPAQLKTVFDRTTPYGDTNLARLNGNSQAKGISIAIRAGAHHEENQLILDSIEHYLGHLGISVFNSFSITQTDSLHDLLNIHGPLLKELKNLSMELSKKDN